MDSFQLRGRIGFLANWGENKFPTFFVFNGLHEVVYKGLDEDEARRIQKKYLDKGAIRMSDKEVRAFVVELFAEAWGMQPADIEASRIEFEI